MFLKFILLCIVICLSVLIITDVLLPRIIKNYKYHKQIKEKRQRREAFIKKMKELEIK